MKRPARHRRGGLYRIGKMTDRVFTVRVNMLISEAEREAIEDYRYLNRIPTFSEAFRRLAAAGLAGANTPLVKPVRR